MPTQNSLNLFERNNDTVPLTITQTDVGAAEDLTSKTVEVYFKTSADISDADATTVRYGSDTGEVTITDAVNGKCQFVVSDSVVDTPGEYTFWRVDLLEGTARRTCGYGAVSVVNL